MTLTVDSSSFNPRVRDGPNGRGGLPHNPWWGLFEKDARTDESKGYRRRFDPQP